MSEPNVLLLDEPTNDLDVETLNVIEDMLDGWPGTLIVVSHDRYFIERVTDRVVGLMGDGKIRGRGHTMLNDGDIDPQRHIRAAVGAVVASVVNDTALFVSGGAEHQGPDGGGMIALIAERNA